MRLTLDILRLLAAGLLFWSLGFHPGGFYTLLRCVVASVAVCTALQASALGKTGLPWAFLAVALVFNPILPIHLQRSLWLPIALAAGALMLAAIPALRRVDSRHSALVLGDGFAPGLGCIVLLLLVVLGLLGALRAGVFTDGAKLDRYLEEMESVRLELHARPQATQLAAKRPR